MSPEDHLLERYREANALDPARPAPGVRENVLARARGQESAAPVQARPAAANDASWRWRALGGLAVLGLATLVVLQFDRGTPEERDAVLAPAVPPKAEPLPEVSAPRPPVPPPPAPAMAAKPAAPPTPPARTRSAESTTPDAAPTHPVPRPPPSAPAPSAAQDRSAGAMAESAPPARAQTRSEALGSVAREVDVNAVDAAGRTALMRAALLGDAAHVRRLLEAGADPLRRDREGRSASDLARAAGHLALLPLLEAAEAAPR